MTHQSKHEALPSYSSLEELSICWAEWGQKHTEAHIYKGSPIGNHDICSHLRETFTGSSTGVGTGTSVETNWLCSPSEEFIALLSWFFETSRFAMISEVWWMAKSMCKACCADLFWLLASLALDIFTALRHSTHPALCFGRLAAFSQNPGYISLIIIVMGQTNKCLYWGP